TQARGDQRVVVRPDRAVVVAHRVVARLPAGECPDPPAREEIRAQQTRAEETRAPGVRDAAEEEMARVRRDHLARPLVVVERQRIGPLALDPEVVVDALAKGSRGRELVGAGVALPSALGCGRSATDHAPARAAPRRRCRPAAAVAAPPRSDSRWRLRPPAPLPARRPDRVTPDALPSARRRR